MKIIVGLGNPEEKYRRTYHNLGFVAAEDAAIELGLSFKHKKCRALVAEGFFKGEKIVVAKPQTYMNLSGESVKELLAYYKAGTEDLIVLYDDYDLPKGAIRIRKGGSAGTHNGMRNIVAELGREDFARVRVGFKGEGNVPLINYVLSGIPEADLPLFAETVHAAGLAAADFARGVPLANVMQKYNKK